MVATVQKDIDNNVANTDTVATIQKDIDSNATNTVATIQKDIDSNATNTVATIQKDIDSNATNTVATIQKDIDSNVTNTVATIQKDIDSNVPNAVPTKTPKDVNKNKNLNLKLLIIAKENVVIKIIDTTTKASIISGLIKKGEVYNIESKNPISISASNASSIIINNQNTHTSSTLSHNNSPINNFILNGRTLNNLN